MLHARYVGERSALGTAWMTPLLAPRRQSKHRLVHAVSRFVFYIRSLAFDMTRGKVMMYVNSLRRNIVVRSFARSTVATWAMMLLLIPSGAVAQGPSVTVWFSPPANEVSDKLALFCSDHNATVVEQDDRHVLCTRPVKGVAAAYLFSGRGGTDPQLMVRFSLLKDGKAIRVQAAQWVETQSSNGQVRRSELSDRKHVASLMDQMIALGSHNYPPDTD